MTSREIYFILLHEQNKNNTPSSKIKWISKFNIIESNWKHIYLNAFNSCRSTKLQSFQYRIINRTITCNHWLFNAKIKISPNCVSCMVDDTIEHFFIECTLVTLFWTSLNRWWKRLSNALYNISDTHILFGFFEKSPLNACLNFILILAKKFIHDCKMNEQKNISFFPFIKVLKIQLSLEEAICAAKGDLDNFNTTFGTIYENI